MPGAVFLRGDRVTLRTVEENDLEFIRDGVNHPDVRSLVGQSFPTNIPQEEKFFDEANENDDVIQVLITAQNDRIGFMEFDPIDRETGTAELAFWVLPEYQREGYAREAAELMLEYAFNELRMHKVSANVYEFNEPSMEFLKDIGFTQEGVLRENAFVGGEYHDTYYFGILEREWRS